MENIALYNSRQEQYILYRTGVEQYRTINTKKPKQGIFRIPYSASGVYEGLR